MKRGFTLIELLAVIAILGLLIGVSVPVYLTISANINQSMSETKIEELKAKSEKYAEETGKSVFDVKTLIEAGVLSPDSELGEYKDPVSGRDMSCDIITMQYQNGSYEASITESHECYEEQYLENLFGMVELYLENTNGQEIPRENENTWLKESKVNVRYRLKPEYERKGIISEISWSGQAQLSCSTQENNLDECQKYLIEAYENGIKNIEVRLQVKIVLNESGASLVNNLSTKVLLDIQRPTVTEGSVTVNNDTNTSGARRVTFELTDGSGSGIKEYAIADNIGTNTCSNISGYKSASEGIQTEYLRADGSNKTYYICVKDKVGNVSSDEDLRSERNQIHIDRVDSEIPKINGITIQSTSVGYNNLNVKVKINATDDDGKENLEMCISQTGYLRDCTWKKYEETDQLLKFNGDYDGQVRTVYVSIRDKAGNTKNAQQNYTVYARCSEQTGWIEQSNTSNSCPACGNNYYNQYDSSFDKYLGDVCDTRTLHPHCPQPTNCCASQEISGYGSWSSCSAKCDGGTKYRDVYYQSAYDHSTSCGTHDDEDSQSCNTTPCCSSTTIDYQTNDKESCPVCGSGTYTRTEYYRSTIDSSKSCGSQDFTENCNAPGCCSKTNTSYGSWYGEEDCGSGYKYRDVYVTSAYDGSDCGSHTQSKHYNNGSCCSCDRHSELESECRDGNIYHRIECTGCSYSDKWISGGGRC